jgi:2-polyprenyl-3-methyl-5-hydroxy-6-metoxy-1,4-benzoquinol methylase
VSALAPTGPRALWRHVRFELDRRLRRPLEGRFQPYSHTLPDRYPWLFDFAKTVLAAVETPRILSFGCSRGDEVFSLHRRFPTASIKGVDIDPANIETCRARLLREGGDGLAFEVASSVREEPQQQYDAIFCLAVLCHADLTTGGARWCQPLMRFGDFEATVGDFTHCLKPGGLLFLHTTNFRFCDTAAADEFDTVLEALPEQLATDVLFDQSGRIMPGERYHPVGFRKRMA